MRSWIGLCLCTFYMTCAYKIMSPTNHIFGLHSKVSELHGPISQFDVMVGSWENQELGLIVYVGPSKKAPGLGLFVSLGERGDNSILVKQVQLFSWDIT